MSRLKCFVAHLSGYDHESAFQTASMANISKSRFFLLVDLREFFFSDLGSGDEKKRNKSSENDQLTGLFQSLFQTF